jgi:hypothetical protein
VAFASTANLTGNNSEGNREIFRVHTNTLVVEQITDSPSGESQLPAIDADGSRIAFQSTADLTGDNSDGSIEIFLYDADTDNVVQITSSAIGTSNFPSLDDAGAWIAFTSNAALATNSTATEVMLYAVESGTLEQISLGVAATRLAPSVSANGERVSYIGFTDSLALSVTVHDIPTKANYPVAESAEHFTPIVILQMVNTNAITAPIDATGSQVLFSAPADLTGANADGSLEVFAATEYETTLIDDAVFSVDENSPVGTVVGQMQPVDPGTQLQFSITGGNFSGIFAIDGATGEITVQSAVGLDHEGQSAFQLTVKAVDSNDPMVFDFATATIEVADINEPPELVQPVDDQLAYAQVAWDFTVASWTFDDADANDVLTYSAVQEDGTPLPAWLAFEGGTLTFSGTPSSNDLGNVIVTLTAYDSGDPALSADDTFKISVAENAYPWQNPLNRYDVNAKDGVTPQDALIVINQLNRTGSGPLPGSGLVAPPYYDVSGNNHLEPLDALQVINYLNRQLNDGGEGERTGREPLDSFASDLNEHELILLMDAVARQPATTASDVEAPTATEIVDDAFVDSVSEINASECATTAAQTCTESVRMDLLEGTLSEDMEELLAAIAEDLSG